MIETITEAQIRSTVDALKNYSPLKERLIVFLYELNYCGDAYYKTESYIQDFKKLTDILGHEWTDYCVDQWIRNDV